MTETRIKDIVADYDGQKVLVVSAGLVETEGWKRTKSKDQAPAYGEF